MLKRKTVFRATKYALIFLLFLFDVFPDFVPENFAFSELLKLVHYEAVIAFSPASGFSYHLGVLPQNRSLTVLTTAGDNFSSPLQRLKKATSFFFDLSSKPDLQPPPTGGTIAKTSPSCN